MLPVNSRAINKTAALAFASHRRADSSQSAIDLRCLAADDSRFVIFDARQADNPDPNEWPVANPFHPLSVAGWQQRKRRHKGTLDTRVSTGEGRGWPD